MRNFVNEKTVMQFYIDQIDADNINFLKGKEAKKAKIRGLVQELLDADTMNGKIQVACDLWKALFDASLSSITSNKKGYDKIFKYFDAYVEFEELIFASDSFYRDHTLHCIWVYFLGEYFRKNEAFAPLFLDMNQGVTMMEGIYKMVDGADSLSTKDDTSLCDLLRVMKKSQEYRDASFCVEAITHDLGYPLKKIEKINKSIKKVLPFFAVNNFEDFSFEYNNVQQEFISNFIDVISRNLTIGIYSDIYLDAENDAHMKVYEIFEKVFTKENGYIVGVNEEAINNLTKEEKEKMASLIDVRTFFKLKNGLKNAFLNDFENYQHGIMSAFVLAKNLEAFQNLDYSQDGNIDMSEDKEQPAEEMLVLSGIMKAISNHTSDGFTIPSIEEGSFLTFVDELEEFSRISRASQNREYVKEFCETYLDIDEDGWFNITFEFHNDNLDNLDPEISFKGRCKRFLSLFDIAHMSQNLKLRVSCIGKLETDQNTYVLEIANHHADILINGESQNIPKYLKATQFYTKEEYAEL